VLADDGGEQGEVSMDQIWLIGWKSIAKYLGISVPTAKRWFQGSEIPVRHPPGMMVRAPKADLDAWAAKYAEPR